MKQKFKRSLIIATILGLFASLTFVTHVYADHGGHQEPAVYVVENNQIITIDIHHGIFDVVTVHIGGHVLPYQGQSVRLDLRTFSGVGEIEVYAMDSDGNRSNVIVLDLNEIRQQLNSGPGNQQQAEPPAATSPNLPGGVRPSNPFTPDGQGTVVDIATTDDGKDFFTFTTPTGNIFFLIVDHQRTDNNVYFLNAVTEQDLIALAEASGNPIEVAPPVPEFVPPAIITPEPEPVPVTEESGGSSLFLFILVGIGVGGAGYYFKVYRPKNAAGFEDDDDFEDDEEMSFVDGEVDDYEEDMEKMEDDE